MSIVWTAITLGFLGSFHCVGMCGPIALALPLNHDSYLSKITGALLYNFGRMFTYSIFGLVFGLLGQSIVIAGYQQALSISLGVLIIIILILQYSTTKKLKLTSFAFLFFGKLKQKLSALFKKKSFSSLFFIGILNGMLPCGFVYLAIAGAIAAGSALNGSLFMAAFGLGTLPAMFTLSLLGNTISINFRNRINKAMPLFILTMALLLIMRGMNLGIPYISPEMSDSKPVCNKCCHK